MNYIKPVLSNVSKWSFIGFHVLFIFILACTSEPPKLSPSVNEVTPVIKKKPVAPVQKTTKPYQIGITGDSITDGGEFYHRFPRTLQSLLQALNPGFIVDTYAIPGQTTEKIKARFKNDILEGKKYDWVIIQAGTNDLYIGLGLKTIKANIDEMIEMANQAGLKVILVTVGPANGQQGWNAEKERNRIALNKWIMLHPRVKSVDMAVVLSGKQQKLKDEFYYTDHIHPNDKGLDAMAEAVFDTVFSWKTVQPGVQYRVFSNFGKSQASDRTLHVVRIDAHKTVPDVILASEYDGEARPIKNWCKTARLAVAINAGMYMTDFLTHTGYLRKKRHINSTKWVSKYKSALVIGPKNKHLPVVDLIDLDEPSDREKANQYQSVVQNLRLIKKNAQNKWKPQQQKWSEAAIAIDNKGRLLFVFSRSPYTMEQFNSQLLKLPLNVVAAQHAEGGPESSLSIHGNGIDVDLAGSWETGFNENDDNDRQWPVPNVIGVFSQAHKKNAN